MFTRHIIKTASPEQVQAALQAGTLAEPYISLITQDSSVEGYESKGLYVQVPEGGAPDMFVKEYVEEPLMYLVGSPSVDYIGGNVTLRGQIHFGAGYTEVPDGYESAVFGVVPANKWEERAEELSTDSSAEIVESFLNPEAETYDAQYIADEISTRSADGSTGNFKSSDDLEIDIPFENEVGYNPEKDYFIIGGFYPQGDSDSTYSYNLGKYVLADYLTDDPSLIEFGGVINGLMNDEFNYWGGITQNDIYPRVAVGFYLQSVFDASFQAAYALDNTLTEAEFLNNTFRDSSMVDVHYYTPYDDGNFYGFDENNLFSMKNYPGFTNEHGDILKMIGWFYDENDDPGDAIDLYSQPTLAVEVTAEDNQATVTAGDNFVDDAYDFILFKVLTQTELDEMVQAGYFEEDAYPGEVNAWLREHNSFDGSLGEGDSSTFEFDTTESANNIYIVGAMYDTNEQQQEYIRYCDSVQYAIDLNDLVIPDSSGDTSTGWNIDASTAWYLDVDFYTNGTQYYTDEASSFSDVLTNTVNASTVQQELQSIAQEGYDYAITLVVDPISYSYGIFQGGRRIPGRILGVSGNVRFDDAYINQGENTFLVYAYNDGTNNHYVCIGHAGFDDNAAYVELQFEQGTMTMSYQSWREMPNTWPNFYVDDQSGTMMFGNNFGMSREDIDTTVFEAPQLQVAHYYKNEYDVVKDSSTFLFNEFLNANSENISVDPAGEGDINSTPFEYDSTNDEIPVSYYVRLVDASTDNITRWQEMGNFPDINVGYGNEHIDSDSSVLYISSSPSNDALTFGYTEARFGVWTNAAYDASVTEGGMDETEFYIANMTLGPVNVENGYDASFNIQEGHSEFIGQCYNPTTQQYWGNINHMYGFDFPIPFEFKTTFNDQTYVVDASAILSAGHVQEGWTQYKYGWYDRSAWENDENGIQEQYNWDENAYRMANVQGTNSYSTTTFTCTADSSKSYRFSVFAIPYRLDGDNNDEHDWEYFREATYDINM